MLSRFITLSALESESADAESRIVAAPAGSRVLEGRAETVRGMGMGAHSDRCSNDLDEPMLAILPASRNTSDGL